jgi:SAM-dependent methyltransferase
MPPSNHEGAYPDAVSEVWASGDAYEPYVGRWSRLVAADFLRWIDSPGSGRWVDVGCGTGAVTAAVLRLGSPDLVVGVDPSPGYVAYARRHIVEPRAGFAVAAGTALPFGDGDVDVVISGLVLNFVPEPSHAVAEMARVVRRGGTVGAYVWDYAGEMQLMRHFWDAAGELDPRARELDEGVRFPLCRPEPLAAMFEAADLTDVRVRPIDVVTRFRDFDDYWAPFLGGQAPAPGYAMSLTEERRAALRERIRAGLPYAADGSITLVARAWAVRGRR